MIKSFYLCSMVLSLSGCCGYQWSIWEPKCAGNTCSETYDVRIMTETQRTCRSDAPFLVSIDVRALGSTDRIYSEGYKISGVQKGAMIGEWFVDGDFDDGIVLHAVLYPDPDLGISDSVEVARIKLIYDKERNTFVEQEIQSAFEIEKRE